MTTLLSAGAIVASAEAAATDGANPLGALIVLIGLLWIGGAIVKAFKPRRVEIEYEGKTTITPK